MSPIIRGINSCYSIGLQLLDFTGKYRTTSTTKNLDMSCSTFVKHIEDVLKILDEFWLDVDAESVEAEMPNHEMYTVALDTIETLRQRFIDVIRKED